MGELQKHYESDEETERIFRESSPNKLDKK